MEKRIHIYSDVFDVLENGSVRNSRDKFHEICELLEKVLSKSCSQDIVVKVEELPLLIEGMKERLEVLLNNRPAPQKKYGDNERYYQREILGQTIIYESEYDRTMGTLDAWMLLLNKAFERQNEVHFLFTECEFHDGSAHSLFLRYKKMSLLQLVEKLKIERNKIESLETVTERLRRLIDSGLLTSGIEDGTEYYSVTAKGSKIII